MPRIGVGGGKFGVHGGVNVGKGGVGYGGGVGPVGASGGFNTSSEPGGCAPVILAMLAIGFAVLVVVSVAGMIAACLMVAPAIALVAYPFLLRGRKPPAAGLVAVAGLGAIVVAIDLLVVHLGHRASVHCNAQPGYTDCVNQEAFAGITTLLLIIAAIGTAVALIIAAAAFVRALAGRSPYASDESSTPRDRLRDEVAAVRRAFTRRPRTEPPGTIRTPNSIRFPAALSPRDLDRGVRVALEDAGFKLDSATRPMWLIVKGGLWRANLKRAEIKMMPTLGSKHSTQCEVLVSGPSGGLLESYFTNKLLSQVASVIDGVIRAQASPSAKRAAANEEPSPAAARDNADETTGRCPQCGAWIVVPSGQSSCRCPECRIICLTKWLVS